MTAQPTTDRPGSITLPLAPPHAMRSQLLNAISIITGTGFTIGLFFSISHFLGLQENTTSAPRVVEDPDMVMVALPTLPPPPKTEDKPAVVAEVSEAIPLGFQEEPSPSPVKIAPSPPSYEQLLPMSQLPSHVVSGTIGIDTSFKPKMDVTFDSDHVYQKSEVDKPPFVISQPDPAVPASLLEDKGMLSVVLLFVVDMHGVAGNVHVLRSSDNAEFDSIIAENIREWIFSPAIKGGKPVRCMVQQLVKVQMGRRNMLSL